MVDKWFYNSILAAFIIVPVLCFRTYTPDDVLHLREEVREMFQHAYEGYLQYAGDFDELRPLSCDGVDTWGSYSLTLIDALDTLAVMGNFSEFQRVVDVLTQKTNFDADINVSVFETNIRIVGGLLGAHLMSLRAGIDVEPGWPCNGPLLRLAEDVAKRLLPAFDTKTGMPYGTVNLRHGVPAGETAVTCTAGVGTFIVEFGALSRLTGDPIYEEVALNALHALWRHRSAIGLFGNHIDVQTGRWTAQDAGIGAGVDSFYEYLVKGGLMLNRPELLEMFYSGRKAIDKYLKRDDWHVWVSMNKGQVTLPVFQSLEAYWPGVLSLIGDIAPAMKTLHNYHSVWKQYGFLPEFYNIPSAEAGVNRENYPLRPELIESVMYLYRATSDPYLLEVGEDMLRSIQHSAKTSCGYATIKNVRDHRKEDRMESFFLAETTKYLYLLFDPDNFLHNDGFDAVSRKTPNGPCIIHSGGYIFNTEAHPIDSSALRCCRDGGGAFKDFNIDEYVGDELERKDEVDFTVNCSPQTPKIPNIENLTIEIETTVDSDESRQKMITEIMTILKKLENESLGVVKKAEEVTRMDKTTQDDTRKESSQPFVQEMMGWEKALESILNSLKEKYPMQLHQKLLYAELRAGELLKRLETLVEEYLREENTTVSDIFNETDSTFFKSTPSADEESLEKMKIDYRSVAYHMMLLNVFQSLHALQKMRVHNPSENVVKSAVNVLFSLKSGVSEPLLKSNYSHIIDIFGNAQAEFEHTLAKTSLTIDFYVHASRLSEVKPLLAKDMRTIISLIETIKYKKRRLEKIHTTVARGPLNLRLFERLYKMLVESPEFNANEPVLLDPQHEIPLSSTKTDAAKVQSSQNDDIILVENFTKDLNKTDLNAIQEKIQSSKQKDDTHSVGQSAGGAEIDTELDVGEGSVEPVNLYGDEETLASPPVVKSEEQPIENRSFEEVKKFALPPKIQPRIDDTTNNSLLTEFVQTLLKSTLPAKPKFEPQLLLEKIRLEGIYSDQPKSFDLLTCRAQPFLQRISINGEFF